MSRPRTCECGECPKCKHREYMRKWYADRPGYAAASVRARRADPERGEELRAYARARYHGDLEHRRKAKARMEITRRVARGQIIRPTICEGCLAEGPTDAHHDDYSRPLDVRWLCKVCHAAEHA